MFFWDTVYIIFLNDIAMNHVHNVISFADKLSQNNYEKQRRCTQSDACASWPFCSLTSCKERCQRYFRIPKI